MRIFVTGATGFVGGHFVERALSKGHEVAAVYHSTGAEKQKFVRQLKTQGARLFPGSVLDTASFAGHLQGIDCVCHFAAAFREAAATDEHFRRVNVQGVANVMRAAAAKGVRRFVLCSTAGIYGKRVPQVIDERAKTRPFNIYEDTKLAGEYEVRRLAAELGMEYVILRPSAVYGPRDQRLLKLFRSAAKGRFPLFGQGTGRRHMIYVTDLAETFLKACTEPQAASQELIVAGPRAVPLREFLAILAHVLGRETCGPMLPLKPMLMLAAATEDVCKIIKVQPPLYRRRMDFYLNDAEFDSRRAQTVLRWRPLTELPDGLAATVQAYRVEGWLAAADSTRATQHHSRSHLRADS